MKYGFMDTMWKRKCSVHNGLKKFPETGEGTAGQIERESNVDGFSFDVDGVVHH
jgi:hypothetical protein